MRRSSGRRLSLSSCTPASPLHSSLTRDQTNSSKCGSRAAICSEYQIPGVYQSTRVMARPALVAPILLLACFCQSVVHGYVEVSPSATRTTGLTVHHRPQTLTANADSGLAHFQPMVSLLCGHGKFQNQYLDENKRWVTDPDPKSTCTRDKLEILEYCRKVSRRLILSARPPAARIMRS